MKKIISVFMCVLMITAFVPLFASATTSGVFGTDDDIIHWNIEDKVLTFSGNGYMKDFLIDGIAPWYDSDFTSVIIESGIKSIGNYAFVFCESLQSITIPDTVEIIETGAFEYCTGLTEIELPEGLKTIETLAFCGCTGINSIRIPSTVTNLSCAFNNCPNLKTIILPDEVIGLEHGCLMGTGFYDDKSNWTDGLLYAGNHIVGVDTDKVPEAVTVREGTKTIAERAFWYAQNMKKITLPNSLTEIGDGALFGCTNLKEIVLGAENENFVLKYGVLFNKDYSKLILYPCTREGIEYVVPSGVTEIGFGAFAHNKHLGKITLPEGITKVSGNAFSGCKMLSELVFPDSLVELGGPNSSGVFNGCEKLRSVTIPAKITVIGNYTFSCCSSLERVIFKGKVYKICDGAFFGCSRLKDVYFAGSEADRSKIVYGKSNEPVQKATWYYNTDFDSIPPLDALEPVYNSDLIFFYYDESYVSYYYKTTVKLSANAPEGTKIQWYIDDEPAGSNSVLEIKEATKSYKVTIIATDIYGIQSKQTLTVHIKNTFFDKIYWFFMHYIKPEYFIQNNTKEAYGA